MVFIQDVRLTDITLKAWRTCLTAAKNSRKTTRPGITKFAKCFASSCPDFGELFFSIKQAKRSFEELILNLSAELEYLRPDLVLCGNNMVIIAERGLPL